MTEALVNETENQYRSAVDSILSVPLTDNIGTYASTALEQLVQLVPQVIASYTALPAESFGTTRELEDAAFQFFGLGDIEAILSHVADMDDKIRALDSVVGRATQLDYIIAPTGPGFTPEHRSEGSDAPAVVPQSHRLETVLFVLQQDFQVNIHDPNRLLLAQGIAPSQAARRAGYYLIDVPELNRLLLVCNAPSNMTYVFDSQLLGSMNYQWEDIAHMSKQQLNALLGEHPEAGQRIRYSHSRFPSRVIAAIESPDEAVYEDTELPHDSPYLYPPAPDGIVSVSSFGESIGMDAATTSNVVDGLIREGMLAELPVYRFGNFKGRGLDESQRAIVQRTARDANKLAPFAPKGYTSARHLADNIGSGVATILRAYENLLHEGRVEQAQIYRFGQRDEETNKGAQPALGLSREQQRAVLLRLVQTGRKRSTREKAALLLAKLSNEPEIT